MSAVLPIIARDDLLGTPAVIGARPARPAPRSPVPAEPLPGSSRVDLAVGEVAARGAGSPPPADVQLDSLVPQTRRPGEPRDSLSSPVAPLRSGPALFLYSVLAVYAAFFALTV